MAENWSRCQKNVTRQGAVTFTNNLAESCWIEIRIILSIKLTPDYSVYQINSGLFRGYKITLCYSGAYIPLVVVWLRKQTFAKLTLMEWPVSQPKFFSAFFFFFLWGFSYFAEIFTAYSARYCTVSPAVTGGSQWDWSRDSGLGGLHAWWSCHSATASSNIQ